jgi:hypothetical protein
MTHLCEFQFSDGAECLKTATASIENRWYCAEHFDAWMRYYHRAFHIYGNEEAGRTLKANR